MYTKTLTAASGLACVALALSGCGSGSDSASGATSGGSGKAASAHGTNVTITSPRDGANVQLPITVSFTTSKPIGPESSGKDHVHFIVDGKTDQYTVVRSSPYQIKSMPMGKHTIGVTLQHADHSPDGSQNAQITVNVTGGGSGSGGGSTGGSGGSGGSGGGGYGY